MKPFVVFAALVAAVLSWTTCPVTGRAAERTMIRDRYVGEVAGFDEPKRLVMVDIGSAHGVLRGMDFAVVDDKGGQVATVRAGEVYDNLFWSDEMDRAGFRSVRYGMEVRWLFTPESTALLRAGDAGTPEAYAEFFAAYPRGRLAVELAASLDPAMKKSLDEGFAAAWDTYTADALGEYATAHPGTAFGLAAEREAGSIREFESSRKRGGGDKGRAHAHGRDGQDDGDGPSGASGRPAGGGASGDETRASGADRDGQAPFDTRYSGFLVNNSPDDVTFEFDPPATLGKIAVPGYGRAEVLHKEGVYTYRVFVQEDEFGQPVDGFREIGGGLPVDGASGFGDPDFGDPDFGEPGFGMPADDMAGFAAQPAARTPAAVGSADIQFDGWEAVYP